MSGVIVHKNINISSSISDAEFIGWQKNSHGGRFALYNITVVDHPLNGSTVTEESLRGMNLKVPRIPSTNG
jgi:hypothetical protein